MEPIARLDRFSASWIVYLPCTWHRGSLRCCANTINVYAEETKEQLCLSIHAKFNEL